MNVGLCDTCTTLPLVSCNAKIWTEEIIGMASFMLFSKISTYALVLFPDSPSTPEPPFWSLGTRLHMHNIWYTAACSVCVSLIPRLVLLGMTYMCGLGPWRYWLVAGDAVHLVSLTLLEGGWRLPSIHDKLMSPAMHDSSLQRILVPLMLMVAYKRNHSPWFPEPCGRLTQKRSWERWAQTT